MLNLRILCFCYEKIQSGTTLHDHTFRHYTTTHSDINAQYPVGSELRKDFIAKKEGSLTSQQSFFTKAKEQSKSAVVASYEVALLLARKKKPFTDAEEKIKPSLIIAARMLGDKKCET